eukprot:gene33320-40305_t
MKAKAPSNNSKQQQSTQKKGENGKASAAPVSLPPVNANKASSPTKTAGTQSKSGSTDSPDKIGSKITDEKLPAISNLIVSESTSANADESANNAAIDELLNQTTPAQTTSNLPEAITSASTVPADAAAEASQAASVDATPNPPAEPAYNPSEHNGNVTLIYEQYNEPFPIVNGSTTQENIDEVYCLSFVMPNCLIHLSTYPPAEWRILDAEQKYEGLYIKEEPRGVYQGLMKDATYYVYVEQEAQQLKRDQEMTRQRLAKEASSAPKPLPKDDGRVLESCSCIYGNPCVDEYGCKDWNNRFAVATKNGWKGF